MKKDLGGLLNKLHALQSHGARYDLPDDNRQRWVLLRHGYIAHVQANQQQWTQNHQSTMLRELVHALGVGAALAQGKVSDLSEVPAGYPMAEKGIKNGVTWHHMLAATTGLNYTDIQPGERFHYDERNVSEQMVYALAHLYGVNHQNNYQQLLAGYPGVIKTALTDAIGMTATASNNIQIKPKSDCIQTWKTWRVWGFSCWLAGGGKANR